MTDCAGAGGEEKTAPLLPARSLHVARGDRRLHLLEWDGASHEEAPVLLFVHGGCANAHWWCHSAAHLAGEFRVLSLDLGGHGDSDPLSDGNYSLEGHRDDLIDVVRQLELRRVALIGHSFGGFVSLIAAPHLAGHLSALILVDSRGHIRPRAARYLAALCRFPNPVYASRDEAMRSFQLLPRHTAASAEVLAHVAAHSIRRTADDTWTLAFDRRALRAAQTRDLSAEMRHVPAPVLLVRGSESTALSAPAQRRLAAEIPGARTVEIAGAHHHVMLDRPGAFAAAVAAFLRDCAPDESPPRQRGRAGHGGL